MKMLKNYAGTTYQPCYLDCSCCVPKRDRRRYKKIAKRREERQWRKDLRQDY